MKEFRHILTVVCSAAAFIANAGEQLAVKSKDAVSQAAAADLQLLQGTWEGVVMRAKGTSKRPDLHRTGEGKTNEIDLDFLETGVLGSPRESGEKITIRITGHSFHFHRDNDFWFDTAITLTSGANPKQLHATIKGCPPSQADSIGKVVGAIFKIEDGKLTLATSGHGAEEMPKSFEAAEDEVLTFYELRKVQPADKNPQPSKAK